MEEETKKVYLTQMGLLGEWWHVDEGVTQDEALDIVYGDGRLVDATRTQVGQRLFGGFPCGNGNGTHFYHAAGHYTYLGVNRDLSKNARFEVWAKLLNGNKIQFEKIDRTAPFASDCPLEIPEPITDDEDD